MDKRGRGNGRVAAANMQRAATDAFIDRKLAEQGRDLRLERMPLRPGIGNNVVEAPPSVKMPILTGLNASFTQDIRMLNDIADRMNGALYRILGEAEPQPGPFSPEREAQTAVYDDCLTALTAVRERFYAVANRLDRLA